jgi:hypothetical protein
MQYSSINQTRRLTVVASLISIVYGVAACAFIGAHVADLGKSDVLGSFLQGVFSPLAFLWLIVGYQLQRKELELQRSELQQNNATQTEQQAAMARQADLIAEQLNLAREQTTLQYDVALVLEGARVITSDGKSRTDLEYLNIGATVYVVSFGVRCPPTFPNGDLSNSSKLTRSHLKVEQKGALQIRPSVPEGSCIELIVRYQRADGRTRETKYLFDASGNILIPLGSKDIQKNELFGPV